MAVYKAALKAGAIGGKLLGAGGGGFFLFYAPPERHLAIRKALRNLKEFPFHLEGNGSTVILNRSRSLYNFDTDQKYIGLFDEANNENKIPINDVGKIEKYADR